MLTGETEPQLAVGSQGEAEFSETSQGNMQHPSKSSFIAIKRFPVRPQQIQYHPLFRIQLTTSSKSSMLDFSTRITPSYFPLSLEPHHVSNMPKAQAPPVTNRIQLGSEVNEVESKETTATGKRLSRRCLKHQDNYLHRPKRYHKSTT